jgi:hypothetical protein
MLFKTIDTVDNFQDLFLVKPSTPTKSEQAMIDKYYETGDSPYSHDEFKKHEEKITQWLNQMGIKEFEVFDDLTVWIVKKPSTWVVDNDYSGCLGEHAVIVNMLLKPYKDTYKFVQLSSENAHDCSIDINEQTHHILKHDKAHVLFNLDTPEGLKKFNHIHNLMTQKEEIESQISETLIDYIHQNRDELTKNNKKKSII